MNTEYRKSSVLIEGLNGIGKRQVKSEIAVGMRMEREKEKKREVAVFIETVKPDTHTHVCAIRFTPHASTEEKRGKTSGNEKREREKERDASLTLSSFTAVASHRFSH